MSAPRLRIVLLSLVTIVFGAMPVAGDGPPRTVTVKGPDGKNITLTNPSVPAPGSTRPGSNPSGKKEDDKKSGDAKDGDKKDDKEPPEPKIIRRGDRESGDGNPDELKVELGSDGKVAFQFNNQEWVDLVQWLAQISGQPLDWQDLPGDKVNLRSPGRYSVAQTKDLFNRHLLSRGYTLLEMPGGITVTKTEGINPAMVPRVTTTQLENMMPHSFVRTSLELGWLNSEKLAEELKPMISSNGKLTALTTTNRIEAMDAAINLQQIVSLLEQERGENSRDALAPEFRLRHISAELAKTMLEEFLGVEKKQPMTPQQIQMMQQMAARSGNKTPPQPKKVEISIVANVAQNSVLIRAPADRIAVASEFINRIDVPSQNIMSLADVESRVQVYRLFSIGPEQLIEIIKEMNVLEPSTRIRADEDNKALIVSGSAADRFIIDKLVKRLDGSGREFEVLQLRRLDATEVAESIAFLMGKDKDKEENNSSRRYYYYGYGGNDSKDSNEDEFRVAANARFRQVLLWANEYEMEQVRKLLVKLGELPPPGGSRQMIRRIEASTGPETYQYLLELKQQFKMMSGSELVLPDSTEFVDPIRGDSDQEDSDQEGDSQSDEEAAKDPGLMQEAEDTPSQESAEEKVDDSISAQNRTHQSAEIASVLTAMQNSASEQDTSERGEVTADSETSSGSSQRSAIQSAQDFDRFFGQSARQQEGTPNSQNDSKPKGPIEIKLDPNGNLVLMGKDTKALDALESLMLRMSPPRRPYHVFKIKHQTAGYIQLNLEEYFANNEETDSDADRLYRWWYDIEETEDQGPAGLGKSGELRFVYDPDTNTIVVSGASESQLRTIGELIELWDVAEPVNKRRMRYTKLVNVEYGRAEKIAETVKEAYRDLLSSNDKTFAKGGRGGGGGGGGNSEKSSGREEKGSGLVDSENGRDGGDVDFSFKGKLSLGIDEIGNTLLVSAEGEPLLELVEDMIRKLDEAARPTGSVQIMSVSGKASSSSIKRVIQAFGGSEVGAPGDASPPGQGKVENGGGGNRNTGKPGSP